MLTRFSDITAISSLTSSSSSESITHYHERHSNNSYRNIIFNFSIVHLRSFYCYFRGKVFNWLLRWNFKVLNKMNQQKIYKKTNIIYLPESVVLPRVYPAPYLALRNSQILRLKYCSTQRCEKICVYTLMRGVR